MLDELKAICPVFNSHVKVCQAEFDKQWAAARGTGAYTADECDIKALLGEDHPAFHHAIERCALDQKSSCDAFATCAVGLMKYDGSSTLEQITEKYGGKDTH